MRKEITNLFENVKSMDFEDRTDKENDVIIIFAYSDNKDTVKLYHEDKENILTIKTANDVNTLVLTDDEEDYLLLMLTRRAMQDAIKEAKEEIYGV